MEDSKNITDWQDVTDWEEVSEDSEPSAAFEYLGAPALGAMQGLSLGFADEAEALIRALGPETYGQALQESRQKYKEAEEISPALYTGGDILSSLIPMLGTAGTGLGLKAGQKAAELGLKQALKRTATAGAATGAISGLGQSEAESIGGNVLDTAAGGILGAGLGALGEVGAKVIAPKLAAKADELIPATDWKRKLIEYGKRGIPFESATHDPYEIDVSRMLKGKKEKLAKDTLDIDKKFGQEFGNIVDNAKDVKIDIGDTVQSNIDRFNEILASYDKGNSPPALNKLKRLVESLQKNAPQTDIITGARTSQVLSPREVKNILDEIREYSGKFDMNDKELNDFVRSFGSDLNERLAADVPGYKEAMAAFKSFREGVLENIQNKGVIDPEFTGKWFSESKYPKKEFLGALEQNVINQLQSAGGKKQASPIMKNLRSFYEQADEKTKKYFEESMGVKNIEDLITRFEDPAADRRILFQVGQQPLPTMDPAKIAQQETVGGAGKFSATALKSIGAGQRMVKNAFDYPVEKLGSMAQRLRQSSMPGASAVGEKLQKAVDSGDLNARNAALFVLAQSPTLRDIIKPDIEEEVEE